MSINQVEVGITSACLLINLAYYLFYLLMSPVEFQLRQQYWTLQDMLQFLRRMKEITSHE